MENNQDVKKFVVHYEDGSQKVIEKGFFCEMKYEEDGARNMSFIMNHVSGTDLEHIIMGCIQLGEKLGMFDDKKICSNDECCYHSDEECPAADGCPGYEQEEEHEISE